MEVDERHQMKSKSVRDEIRKEKEKLERIRERERELQRQQDMQAKFNAR